MFRYLTFTTLFFLSAIVFAQGSHPQGESRQALTRKNITHKQATAADILSSLSTAKQDKTIVVPPLLTGSAELGMLYKTGNSNSGDIKSGLDLRLQTGRWLSLLDINILLKKADIENEDGDTHFETTDQKWTATSQTNYTIDKNEKNYIYGNIWYEDNEFSSFVNQSSISSGWGRNWYKSDKASLWGDIGPGYKRDLVKSTDTEPSMTEDSWIVQIQALYIRKLGQHIELKQSLSAKHAIRSSDNSIYKAETTITTKLISTLQLKFTFTLDYNTDVEDDTENTDTQTAATLVYSF